MTDRPYNVLFLCTGNSARSIIAEAILNKLGRGSFAPTAPEATRRDGSTRTPSNCCDGLGYDTSAFAPSRGTNSPNPARRQLDFVFTVCDNAAGETCPFWPGQPMTAHWGVPDPAEATGTAGGNRPRLQGRLPDAESAHRDFHGVADAQPRQAEPAAQAARDRPHGRRDGARRQNRPDGARSDVAPPRNCSARHFCWPRSSAPASWRRGSPAVTSRWRCWATHCRPAPFSSC